MKLLVKGLLLVAIPCVFQIGMLATLFSMQQRATEAERQLVNSKETLRMSEGVVEPILEESIRFRGTLLARQPELSGDAFWSDLDRRLAYLQQQVAANPPQAARVQALRETAKKYREALRSTYDIALAEGMDGIARRYRPGGGIAMMSQFKAQLAEFLKEEERLDVLRSAEAQAVRQKLNLLLIAMALVSILIAVGAAYVFSRGIGRRLKILAGNATRLASGDPLDAPFGGADEISLLDTALHTSSLRLAEADRLGKEYKAQLQQRAAELEELNNDLRRQTQDNEMFVYSVSHDLRSPLVNLQGFGKELAYSCDELRGRIVSADLDDDARRELMLLIDGDIKESLRYLNNAVLRSANIIDALLKLSRVGRIEYHVTAVDVAELAGRVVDALHATIVDRRVEVVIGELPPVDADMAALEQVFGNLIHNAVNYLDPQRPGRIEIGCAAADENEVIYHVKDNGLGIASAHLDKLFVAFKRLHPNAAPGEGIGLAYVRRVVERHGGRVWAESEESVGSTFFIAFPRAVR